MGRKSPSRSKHSGRSSAEPLEYFAPHRQSENEFKLVTSLSELDLRNLDPEAAAKLLEQINAGVDVEPLLDQLKSQLADPGTVRSRDKMVTFEDENFPPRMEIGDISM